MQWETSVNDELVAIARERGVPLIRARQRQETNEGEDSSANPPRAQQRFLYDVEDLLETIVQISNTAQSKSPHDRQHDILDSPLWGLVKIDLATPDFRVLRRRYVELSPSCWQIGIDDNPVLHWADSVAAESSFLSSDKELKEETHTFIESKRTSGERVIGEGFTPAARQYAKTGVPTSHRPRLWRVCLGLSPQITPDERRAFAAFKQHVEDIEFVTDVLFSMDVQTITDSDHYFPFEEAMVNVALAFSRDSWSTRHSAFHPHKPLHEPGAACLPDGDRVPMSGLQPFKGFGLYIAPLTFVYEDEDEIYFTFREMFARYWCRLNVLSPDESTLIGLSQVFEQLLQIHDPQLFFHLIQIGSHPLRIALPWIHSAFVSLLPPDQVLLLWDRIIGFDDVTILPVLAAAIFVYRSREILQTTDPQRAVEIFSDGSELRVVVLLQNFMFPMPVESALKA